MGLKPLLADPDEPLISGGGTHRHLDAAIETAAYEGNVPRETFEREGRRQ